MTKKNKPIVEVGSYLRLEEPLEGISEDGALVFIYLVVVVGFDSDGNMQVKSAEEGKTLITLSSMDLEEEVVRKQKKKADSLLN